MIKISSLTTERREGKATLTFEQDGEIKQEEIRISFKKPTEALWRELVQIENESGADNKVTLVAQLLRVDMQSPDITNDDDSACRLTEDMFNRLDVIQLAELWAGVKAHFFLQMPASTQETNTNSTSAQTAG